MKTFARTALAAAIALCALTLPAYRADASGTVRIQQRDGETRTYKNVNIRIKNQAMALTAADGQGRIVFGKASCTLVGVLVRCFAYDATLEQLGKTRHIPLTSGTAWLNPTRTAQTLPSSSTPIQPHGVVLAARTNAGTYVSCTGTVDELIK